MDSSSSLWFGREHNQLNKVNLDWRKYVKIDLRIKTGRSGENCYVRLVRKAQNALSGVLVSGQPRYIHHNDYGCFIIPVQPEYYIAGIEKTGTTNLKYQFDECKRDDDNVFAFESEVRNVELKYIPNDAIPVDIVTARHG